MIQTSCGWYVRRVGKYRIIAYTVVNAGELHTVSKCWHVTVMVGTCCITWGWPQERSNSKPNSGVGGFAAVLTCGMHCAGRSIPGHLHSTQVPSACSASVCLCVQFS
jgi:hypothetical protein